MSRVYKIFKMKDGRFRNIAMGVNLRDSCFECHHFNKEVPFTEVYRCASHFCPGFALSDQMKEDMVDGTK